MPETAAEKRARIARELADLETQGGDAPVEKPRRLSKAEREQRKEALRGDLPLPGVERRPHLSDHERIHRQWPRPESAEVPHESHNDVDEHLARRWPTAHRESNR